MIDYYEPNLDLTLMGCGFLGIYHLGAIYLLEQIWTRKPYNRICGASCGGIMAVFLVAGLKLDFVLSHVLDVMRQLRNFITNPCLLGSGRGVSVGELVERKLEQTLPEDAHHLCSDRLGIVVTKLWRMENEFVSEFRSRRDLIDVVSAGCYIPIWSGFKTPTVRGRKCIDGGYTDNTPKFPSLPGPRAAVKSNEPRQVLLCGFSCSADVSPRDRSNLFKVHFRGIDYQFSWNNVIRFSHALFPCSLDKYRVYMERGHQDMKDYLLRRNLIQCHKCWSDNPIQKGNKMSRACLMCLRLLERVDSLKVPEELLGTFEE